MRRRALLASIGMGLVAGCTSVAQIGAGAATDDADIEVLDWVDAETETMDVEYGAVRVDATALEDAPFHSDFAGLFSTGTTALAVRPSDAENYGTHGENLYRAEDPQGWLIMHPDEEDARLVELGHSPSSTTWERS